MRNTFILHCGQDIKSTNNFMIFKILIVDLEAIFSCKLSWCFEFLIYLLCYIILFAFWLEFLLGITNSKQVLKHLKSSSRNVVSTNAANSSQYSERKGFDSTA